jgi:hypothetical protein
MYNVKDLPAKIMMDYNLENAYGDGINPDTARLQAMIDARLSPLYFPDGRYLLNDTLRFPHQTGYHLVGSGLARPVPDQSAAQGAEAALVWGGGANIPMIEYQGVGLLWSGLSLWGCNYPAGSSSCSAARAKYGIKLCKPLEQVGTGQVWFDSILIANCDEALRTSYSASTDAPCRQENDDTLAFGYFWCQDCGIGLHLVHRMSMMYTFQYIHSENVGTIFLVDSADGLSQEFAGGGAIYTQAVAVHTNNSTILDVKYGGVNNAHYDIGGVMIGPNALNVHLLRNDTNTFQPGAPDRSVGSHTFRFRDGHFRNSVFAEIDRRNAPVGSVLELLGCRGVSGAMNGKITIKAHQAAPSRLIVRDCEVDSVASLMSGTSINHEYDGVGNWTFDGYVGDQPNGT